MAVSVPQIVWSLGHHWELRLGPHARKEPRLQQPIAVCFNILQWSTHILIVIWKPKQHGMAALQESFAG